MKRFFAVVLTAGLRHRPDRRRPNTVRSQRLCRHRCGSRRTGQDRRYRFPGGRRTNQRRPAQLRRPAEESTIPSAPQLKALSDEVDNLTKQLQAQGDKLSDAERASRAKTIDDKKKQLDRYAEDAQNDFQQEMQEVYNALASKVYDVLADLCASSMALRLCSTLRSSRIPCFTPPSPPTSPKQSLTPTT